MMAHTIGRAASLVGLVLASHWTQVALAHRSASKEFDWHSTKYLLAFGDSYTFIHGTLGRQNFSFIGDYLPGNFSYAPEQLLSNKIVQDFYGTAEGGPNWVQFLTGCGVESGLTLPTSCPLQLWDFAFAGADVSEELTPLHHDYTIPLVNQTQQFLTYGEPVFRKQLSVDQSRTLVAIWIGINDINDSSRYNVTFQDFYNRIITTMFAKSVEPLYNAGYHKFLFLNLPPLDRTPASVTNPGHLPNKTMVDWWDDTLAAHARQFAEAHQDAVAMIFDANAFLNKVMDKPGEFGLTNITSFCPGYTTPDVLTSPEKYGCAPLNQYFWFNSGHMTSRVHEIMAPEVDKFLRKQSG